MKNDHGHIQFAIKKHYGLSNHIYQHHKWCTKRPSKRGPFFFRTMACASNIFVLCNVTYISRAEYRFHGNVDFYFGTLCPKSFSQSYIKSDLSFNWDDSIGYKLSHVFDEVALIWVALFCHVTFMWHPNGVPIIVTYNFVTKIKGDKQETEIDVMGELFRLGMISQVDHQ